MKIIISDKKVKIIDKEKLRTGNVNTYLIDVEYSDVYKDRALNLYFKNGDIKKIEQVGPNNVVKIPHEVLEKTGLLFIGIFSPNCKDNTLIDRYCSNLDTLEVTEGAYDKDATYTEELSPSILEQYLQEMKDFYNESIKEYNENALLETNKFNTNADNRKKEIDAVALNVEEDKKAVEKIQEIVELSEQSAKESADNAKTSEQSAQNSLNKVTEIETNVTSIQADINSSKAHIDKQKENVDASVKDVEKLVDEATNQARISKEQAELSTTKAGQVSADKNAVESMKNEVSSMKTSVEQTKADAEQIKTDTQGIYDNAVAIKEETLEAKESVENSLENERIKSDKSYAKAIESDEIVVEEHNQVILDEDGYMKDVSIESNLPDIAQITRSGQNLFDVRDIKRKSDKTTIDENDIVTITGDNTNGTAIIFENIFTNYSDRFLPNHKYYLVAEIIEINGNERITFSSNNNYDNPQFITSVYYDFNALSVGQKIIAPIYTGENIWMGLRTFVSFGVGRSGSIKFRISILENEPNAETFEYEKFGISPSLEFPSEFENIVSSVDIQVNGKNLCSISKFYDGNGNAYSENAYPKVQNGFIFENINERTRIACFKCYLRKGRKYTVNYNFKNLGSETAEVQCYLPEISQYVFKNKPFVAKEDVTLLGVYIDSKYINNSNIKIEVKEIQVEENEVATDFEVFKGYTEKVDLAEGQFLGKFEGFKNYIEKNKLKGQLKLLTLDGTENWIFSTTKEKTQVFRINEFNIVVEAGYLSNYFIPDVPGDEEKVAIAIDGIYFAVNKEKASTLDEWKALLKRKYEEGNPVKVLYVTTEEFEEDLSTENKTVLNSLKVYKGINNIYSNCKIRFKANKNINNHIEKRLEEVKDIERNISNNKYAKTLKDSVTDKNFVQVCADNPKIDNLVIKGEQLEQETHISTDNILYSEEKYWEVGSLEGLTGQPIEKSARLRTKEFMAINELTDYYCSLENSNYVFVNIHYYNLNNEWITAQQSISDNINDHQNQSFTTPENAKFFKLVIKKVDETNMSLSDISISRPMMVKGTSKIDYVEGYPNMPSLDHPSEIEITTGQNIQTNKNNLCKGYRVTSVLNRYGPALYIKGIKPNTAYTISFKTKASDNRYYRAEESINEWFDFIGTVKRKIYNFTTKEDISKAYNSTYDDYLLLKNNTVQTSPNDFEEIMLVEGTFTEETMPVYEPYEGEDSSVVLPEGQFNNGIGDYKNEIKKIDGKWCLKKYIKELILTGDEKIVLNTSIGISKNNLFIMELNLKLKKKVDNSPLPSISNYFKYEYIYAKDEEHFYLNPSGNLFLYVDKEKYPDVATLKVKLKELYDSGKPIKIYYVGLEIETIELPEETQQVLNSIELMDDLNNLSIDNGTFSFEYNKSLARAFEEEKENNASLQAQIDEIKALLSSTSTASLLAENLAKDNESEVI